MEVEVLSSCMKGKLSDIICIWTSSDVVCHGRSDILPTMFCVCSGVPCGGRTSSAAKVGSSQQRTSAGSERQQHPTDSTRHGERAGQGPWWSVEMNAFFLTYMLFMGGGYLRLHFTDLIDAFIDFFIVWMGRTHYICHHYCNVPVELQEHCI